MNLLSAPCFFQPLFEHLTSTGKIPRHLRTSTIATLWLPLVLWLPLTVHAEEAADPIVVIVSMDGIRHDYPDLGGLPGFERMQAQGARADRLTPVYPSNTFPGHVSLATGAHPQVHGIVDNSFVDRDQGRYFMSADTSWLDAEPLWITAERQGVPTATYFWVGSEQDWRGQGTRYRMAPFDGERPEAEKVSQILEWLALPEQERPRLIMSYWSGTDRVAHRYGPNNQRTHNKLRKQDAHLVQLQQGIDALGLWDRLTLMVVSDHGMTPMGDYVDLQDKLIQANVKAEVAGYTVAHVFVADPAQIPAARAALGDIPNTELLSAEQAQQQHQFMHPTRAGDLVVLAQPPVIFAQPDGFEGFAMSAMRFFGWDFGGHGYDPELADMGAVWLMQGRGITPGSTLSGAHQTDVAPTAAAILGIGPPAQATGRQLLVPLP